MDDDLDEDNFDPELGHVQGMRSLHGIRFNMDLEHEDLFIQNKYEIVPIQKEYT